ncbi:NAD(P)/FAD-dependent oxidoreductase [Hydrogenophaga sp. BPS33]|uniref:NAD(P)/FAD-dependent oxidoreductase n=1 Tax=Hydrogenophaga sp. BPS33 TaxID=2651974 RepID=UPI00131FC56D|nr:FAD-dependent oxidoreductase [Hydrogenophaga sp. BPS33]QHE84152.1 NAD(P)-binding protein [Hydrogenophaga sp. BPS33]
MIDTPAPGAPTCVILGSSHAGAQLATSLRQEGWSGRIVMVGEEAHPPYHRPPLSKTFAKGETTLQQLFIRDPAVYAQHGIELRLGCGVLAIDRVRQQVALADGHTLPYDKLAICTGAAVRKMPVRGADLPGIHGLRAVDDVLAIRADIQAGQQAVVVGAGYIGLEAAAMLRGMGMQVTVLETASRVLARVTSPEVSAFYERVHAEQGVRVLTGVGVSHFEGGDRVTHVVMSDGTRHRAHLVIVGIGVTPRVELAQAAGLAVDDGIVVDAHARTTDPAIVAAGDCTRHVSELYGSVRLESVPNANEQAKSAAAGLCGKDKPYHALPWFWSDQYGLKLQIAGLQRGYDQVVLRGDAAQSHSFAAFYLSGGRLIAADCVNRPQEFMVAKRLIQQRATPDPQALSDDTTAFGKLFAA